MSEEKNVVGWFTSNGKHIPIFENSNRDKLSIEDKWEHRDRSLNLEDFYHISSDNAKKLSEKDLNELPDGSIMFFKTPDGRFQYAVEKKDDRWSPKSGYAWTQNNMLGGDFSTKDFIHNIKTQDDNFKFGRSASPVNNIQIKLKDTLADAKLPKMTELSDKKMNNVLEDVDRLPEEQFLNKYFGTLMNRFGDDVVAGNDWAGWEIASAKYNENDLASMFAKSLKSIYPNAKAISWDKDKVTIKLGRDSGVDVKFYFDENASTYKKGQKGYSVDINYYE